MTYLTDRQITSNKFGESYTTWDFTNGKLLSNHKRILIYSCRCYVSTIDYLLSKYNGIVIDVRFDMVDYKDKEGNIIRDSKIERDAVLEKYGKRINEVTELVDFYYDLIVMNPPYSTYINNEGKKVVNPSQLMVEKASNYLSKYGQIVILCRSRDIGMNAKSGNKIRNSVIFDSIHYSSNNFNFTEVNSSIVGIIGSKEGETSKVSCFIDNTLISKSENQRFLPRIYRKDLINIKSIGLLFKVFNYKNIEKFGNGNLYLWNGLMNYKQAVKEGLTKNHFNGLRLVSCNQAPKNWSILGENAEKDLFNRFLFSKLFIFLGDAEAQDQRFKIRSSTSSFIKGCIPDNWRELDTDEKIYTHFNLTQEEIDFVENYQVQCYSSSTGTSTKI